MRNLYDLDAYRVRSDRVLSVYGNYGDDKAGVFELPSPRTGSRLFIIASSDLGWDHVSVSLPNRCPNWHEMELVKRTFFADDEIAMQLHVPPKDHISFHPNCLHLWRPIDVAIPLPPKDMVA